ncbi:MAG: amino acid adenylation domain-containing protein [Cyanobacteria bacterium P01_F01_bin.143]
MNTQVESKTLKNLTESERRQILVTYLQAQIAKLIGVEPSDVEEQQPLQYLGIDSLIAVKLRNRLRKDLAVDISAVKFMADASLADLVVAVSQLVMESQSQTSPSNASSRDHDVPKSYPLTYGQQGLWFLAKLVPDSAAYNIAFTARICSDLNIGALQRALQKLVDRHPTLRTIFQQQDGEPEQIVQEQQEVKIRQIDAATWNESELRERAIAANREPFDLEQGVLLRVTLFVCAPQDYLLLLSVHHIAIDGFSLGIMLEELRSLYQGESRGEAVTLPPIERQYGDFVRWQKEMIPSPVGESHWNYWRQQLGGELPILKLPVDHPRSMIKNQRGASYTFELDHSLTEGLRAIAKEQGATLYMTLLATYQVLLYRYTGQSDIIVGSPAGGRSQSEFERTVGFFINMLALRVKITDNLTFSALLSQVRQTVLAALAHQDYPSALLIERLQVNHDATLSGLFQVTFNLLKLQDMGADYELSISSAAPRKENWGGLTLEPFVIPQQEGQYELGLDLMETSESIFGIFRYDTDLFEVATIERMAGHLQNLLSAIAENSEQAVGLLPMLESAEKEQLEAGNETQQDFGSACFTQLVEAQVERSPDAVAVVFEQQQLTYRELNSQANQLAQHLQNLGIKPDGLVAICLDRSLEMLVGLLAILKAGGAYVPIDPAYPQERLTYILADSEAKIVLTQRHIVPRLQLDSEIELVCLDENFSEHTEVEPIINHVNHKIQPENLAYLIYTSGSTGNPKGVRISHQSLANFLLSMKERPGISPEAIMLAVTTLSFDIAALELYLPLIVGARVIIASREVATSGKELGNLIQNSGITLLQATPATYQMLLAAEWNSSQKLKILCGGEELPQELAEKLQQNASSLWNMYGPTEATIWSTVYEVTSQERSAKSSVPIGEAIANTQVYILDSYLQTVPIGVTGELYIGGAGLAQGYHNRPELTGEKFIPNPFLGGGAGERRSGGAEENAPLLYKTGDLARHNTDGNIEFLGRIDNQVKIRGFRIEIGEIEAAIATYPQVESGVVVARSETEGSKYLAAYVTSKGESVNRRQLRSFLQQKLPEYMIPGVFVVLETFPLTPNGKIDRRALPAPDLTQDRLEKFVAPRTPTEAAIAEIMGIVLQLDRIGIYDNFFELGGHSLLATQVISRLKRIFSVELPTRILFEAPTVAELEASVLAHRQGKAELSELVTITRRVSSEKIPLSPAQGRLWYLYQLSDRNASYNMFLAVEMEGEVQVNILEQAIAEIIRRHEVLRTRFELVDDVPVQIIEPAEGAGGAGDAEGAAKIKIAVEDCTAEEVQRLAQLSANEPFAIDTCPLLRVKLLRLSDRAHILLLTAHHIISDAWSMGLLIQELSTLYQAFLADKPSPLAELPLQYGDFALWQQQRVRGEAYQAQIDYWKQHLAGAPPLLELPTDKVRPRVQTFNGATRKFYLERDLSGQIKTLSQKTGTTLFMILLGVFVTLLSRWSNQEDIVVGTPIARRNQEQIEDLIGFFVNTLVLRLDLADNPSFSELLAQVRQVSLDAFDRQDVPFDRVVEAIKPERNLIYSPLFQVMFAWQNAPMGTLELPGLTLRTVEITGEIAKFDLTLAMAETETGLVSWWEYNTDLFEAETIARLGSYFQTLLTAVVATPDQPVSQLPALLSDRARHQILVEWNQTQTEYPHTKCIHELFEVQAARSPNAVAVVYQGSQLTYGELNRRANQLASYLQELGVKPEILVGICLDRSLEMIIALLGVLKAGGAYLPLDPNYPQERLSFILDNARVSVLLTQEQLVTELPEQDAKIILLDRDLTAISLHDETNLAVATTPDNLAYTIYTSGSTGQAKGVQVIHRSLVNAYQGWSDAYKLETLTSHLQMASFSFDVFSGDWIRALGSGAKLVLCPRDFLLEPEKLYQLIAEEKIDSAEFVPAVLKNLVEYVASTQQNLHGLKLLVVGSDTLYVRDWSQFRSVCHEQTRLINSYGVSEATIDSTYFESTTVELTDEDIVPIGKPFENTQIYILDKQLQPVAIGVPGELYLGGVGLSRGYLNRPDLTDEKFIRNPFSANGEQLDTVISAPLPLRPSAPLLYKTGDLAKYLPDGNIEFLGRIDNQVKVRGFRIEVGEIEGVLRSHAQVKEAVVIAREERLGNKYLAAYVVAQSETLTSHDLRELIRQKLPEYMIPGAFVFLDALPLSPNGKIDRRGLPIPDLANESSKTFVPPRTPTEAAIADIMASVLELPQVGIYDNFFELGGHSLLATQVISRLRRTFSLEFPLRRLLEYPTVEGLEKTLWELRQVENQGERSSFIPLPKIIPELAQRYQPFPLTDIQQAYWLGRNEAFELGNVATHGYLEIEGSQIDLERLNLAWHQVVKRHDQLRMVVLADGQQQVLEEVPNYEIEALELHSDSAEEVAQQLNQIRDRMSHDMISLDSWPLFEIRATVLPQGRTRLHLGFDATVGDAWSMFIVLREWLQLYENLEVELPRLELTFRDYVLAKENLQDTPQYLRSQQYWYDRLDTLAPAPELPLAVSPSSIIQPKFKRRTIEIDPAQWQKLQERAKQSQITPSGLLLSAFAEIIGLWSKSAKFTINLTLFNRFPLHSQVNEIVGDFTSITLLEINREANSFIESSQEIQKQLWQDLDHSYIGGLEVQRELNRRKSSWQAMPIVFTSTLGLDSLGRDVSLLDNLGELVYSISQTSQVWLDCQIGERNGALTVTWDGVEALFPAGMLDDMFSAFCELLERLATSNEFWHQTERSLLSETQLSQRRAVNDTEAPLSGETLHSLFIKQVGVCANSPAIISSERTLTYKELYDRANGLAHQLRDLGATPNSLVAIIMSKGWEQIVGVLGILISGAAYLPIDPTLPQERQQYLLEQGNVKLVVTQSDLEGDLSWLNKNDYSCLYVEDQDANYEPLELVQSNRDLAYVIYTSGSTGLPKGVAIDHRGAVNTILDINQRFKVEKSDRILAISSLNFDLSVYDIFGILAVGGAIVVPTADLLKDPACWRDLIVKHNITIWNSVPAIMQMLSEYLATKPETSLPLRLALLSGDWLPVSLPSRISEFCPSIEVVSLGGATEASIWSICYPIQEVDPNWTSIPYGKPLANQRFYVLNELMETAPVWVPGQLYIGGVGLALCYWQDEAKTNGSFITHPVTGERLYKTGDLGRYLPNGNIEFLGRGDFQVKINGYRIELGEIEAVLQQHPEVTTTVVTAVGEEPGSKQLAAYIVRERDQQGTKSTQNLVEAYEPQQLEGVLTDPLERIKFKLSQPGLQKLDSSVVSVKLPSTEFDEETKQAYLERQSYREFSPQPLELEQLSKFLSCLRQMKLADYPLPKYLYPSAGNLYPVQTYLFVKPDRVAGLAGGVYYYHRGTHNLLLVNDVSQIDQQVYGANQPIFEGAAFSIFLIGQLQAISPMYGELARDFCLLEAGHIGQLLAHLAPKQEIGLCPIGYLAPESIQDLLKLASSQILLYSFVGGKINLSQTQQWFKPQNKQSERSLVYELRQYLQQKLPQYMVPSSLMFLESLPLTSNGKINRQALPAPEIKTAELNQIFVPPRNSVESLLANIWQEVLTLERVGINDNFFELGGESFLALQVISKINKQLSTDIPLSVLFQHPTIAQLAALVAEDGDILVEPNCLVPIQTEGTQPPLFCIHPVGGQVMAYKHLANCLGNDRPIYGLQSCAINDPNQEYKSIEEMAIAYTQEIRQQREQGPYYLLGWSLGGVLAVNIAQQLEQQQQQVAFVGLVDSFLISENISLEEQDPFVELASVFGGEFVTAITNLEASQQQALREKLVKLSSRDRLQHILTWGQSKNILTHDISLDVLQKQLTLTEIHRKLLSGHSPPKITTKLNIWWAGDRLGLRVSHTDWGEYTTGDSYSKTLTGNHFSIVRPPQVAMLARELQVLMIDKT